MATRAEQVTEIHNMIGKAKALASRTLDLADLLSKTESEEVRAALIAMDGEVAKRNRDELVKLRQSIWYQIGKLTVDANNADFLVIAEETINVVE